MFRSNDDFLGRTLFEEVMVLSNTNSNKCSEARTSGGLENTLKNFDSEQIVVDETDNNLPSEENFAAGGHFCKEVQQVQKAPHPCEQLTHLQGVRPGSFRETWRTRVEIKERCSDCESKNPSEPTLHIQDQDHSILIWETERKAISASPRIDYSLMPVSKKFWTVLSLWSDLPKRDGAVFWQHWMQNIPEHHEMTTCWSFDIRSHVSSQDRTKYDWKRQ